MWSIVQNSDPYMDPASRHLHPKEPLWNVNMQESSGLSEEEEEEAELSEDEEEEEDSEEDSPED